MRQAEQVPRRPTNGRGLLAPPAKETAAVIRQLRTTTVLRVHISDYGLCSLIDMDVLHPDVLVTAMT
jgi:hypothetical protein